MGGGFALIPVLLAFGLGTGLVGRRKGSSFWLWFAIGFFAPFIGLLCAFLYRWDSDELRRECPTCGRIVKLHDAVCTKCGTDLEWPETAIAPESGLPPPRTA
jgi:endogenous inhibitor of DNA gyrase (YacG/DUF329 family)